MPENKEENRPHHGRRRRGRRPRKSPAKDRPVPLIKRTGSHFQPGDRQRGAEYFHEGRVRLEVEGARARAHVQGTEQQLYRVGLDWSLVESKRVLHVFCECQRFAGGKPCKHLRATLLALAETGPENHPPGRDRLGLRKDRATSWPDLGIPVTSPNGKEAANNNRTARPSRRRTPARSVGRRAVAPTWRTQFAAVQQEIHSRSADLELGLSTARSTRDLRLLVNTTVSLKSSSLVLDLFEPTRGAGGKPGKLKRANLSPDELDSLLSPTIGANGIPDISGEPVSIVAALPAEPPNRPNRGRRGPTKPPVARMQSLRLPEALYEPVLRYLCSQGVLGWWNGRSPGSPPRISWDDGPPWKLALRLESTGGMARLSGALERDGERLPLSSSVLVLPGKSRPTPGLQKMIDLAAEPPPATEETEDTTAAPTEGNAPDGASANVAGDSTQGSALVFFGDRIARLAATRERDFPWITLLRESGEIIIPKDEIEEALTWLLELPDLPRLETPDSLQLTEERPVPQPYLMLEPDPAPAWMNPPLIADLSFFYGSLQVSAGDSRSAIVDWEGHCFLRRDKEREHSALVRLLELGLRPIESAQGHGLELSPSDLPAVAEPLLAEGWTVEAHGTSLRPPKPTSFRVESDIDWFELSGDLDFAGDRVELAAVLDAISRGDRFIHLEDGTKGLLPASLVETYDSLAKLAHSSSDSGLRFLPSQALLVDALLVAMPPANVDRAFAELRQKLRSFERIKPKKEPRGFGGTLRGYQRQGLGWLAFLREYGLGGVLADDMGLGKTVQALALLRMYRTPSKTTGLPYLVVAPRSLVYNWIDEAAHFTPNLQVMEYSGPDRESLRPKLADCDLVVTTYGTLRRDIGFLATVEFDTVILDEAQAIKNPTSQTAKASGLLVARHRLALTGTPIENHLGELGSLFDFLNPGLLGKLPKLDVLAGGRAASQQELALVAEGIRPFILRRTKAQVLPDLPPKTEQVLFCTLPPQQRELYDQVRATYQASLLKQVEKKGVSGSAIQVLEALLRLRQIACHPGLVNPEWEEAGSAKLESLFTQVSEVIEEGHKVIVFSQFTSLLAYVRRHLDERGANYAYLDGQTRNRGELVERFQTDPACSIFLISLKAGGVGLNLTAAGYVFLLDPWWNPAVEAQAIDRAHRIGQDHPVFAYRMIARDTVEEKILDLQRSKRQIADAVLEGEGQTLGDLTAEDLKMLLS